MRFLRVAEVEVVGCAERLSADAGQVRGALEHDAERAAVRVGGNAAAVAIDADGQSAAVRKRQHGSVGLLGATHGARLDDRVVLLEERPARSDIRRADQRQQRFGDAFGTVEPRNRRRVERLTRLLRRKVIDRAVINERLYRHLADQLAVGVDPHQARVGDLTDRRRADLPLVADRAHSLNVLRLDHAEHPLLRFADHDLEWLHVSFTQRHLAHIDVNSDLALRCHLAGRRGEAGCAEVLKRNDQAQFEQLE